MTFNITCPVVTDSFQVLNLEEMDDIYMESQRSSFLCYTVDTQDLVTGDDNCFFE